MLLFYLINIIMKLNDLKIEEDCLEEGLIHAIGRLLKYTAIFLGSAFLLRTMKNIIFDKKKEKEVEYYIVIGDVIQIKRGNENKIEDLLEVFSKEYGSITSAKDSSYEYKKISKNKISKDVDESLGKLFNINLVMFYEDRKKINKASVKLDTINDKYGSNFEIIKEGRT